MKRTALKTTLMAAVVGAAAGAAQAGDHNKNPFEAVAKLQQ